MTDKPTDALINFEQVCLELPSTRKLSATTTSTDLAVGGEIIMKRGRHYIRALTDVSINVSPGERIALVGHNGAGKTSLMRLMCGIYQPTSGRSTIRGSVSALFSSAIGLDQNATGLENIRFASVLYGIPPERHKDVIDDVTEFSQLGEYLELPVRTYSAGMKTRLGFAIVTSVNPEILIIDEVLTTGDRAFSERARERVMEFAERAKILVVASHSYGLLKLFCTRAIWMNHGRVAMDGPLPDVWEAYAAAQT